MWLNRPIPEFVERDSFVKICAVSHQETFTLMVAAHVNWL